MLCKRIPTTALKLKPEGFDSIKVVLNSKTKNPFATPFRVVLKLLEPFRMTRITAPAESVCKAIHAVSTISANKRVERHALRVSYLEERNYAYCMKPDRTFCPQGLRMLFQTRSIHVSRILLATSREFHAKQQRSLDRNNAAK